MKSRIAVSVIIPIYNAELYLRECLNSVVCQTLRDIEIICVDDGSTDNSMIIQREYAKHDDRIFILQQENSGAGNARNAGIGVASGEYVAFMDADDFYPEVQTLAKLYFAAKEKQALVCGGSFSFYHLDGSITDSFTHPREFGYTFSTAEEIQYSDYQFDYGYHRFIYNRKFLNDNELRFPPFLRFQDPPFFIRTMITAKLFFAIPDITYCYRLRANPLQIENNRQQTLDCISGLSESLELAKANHLQKLYRLIIERCSDDYWPVLSTAEQKYSDDPNDVLGRFSHAVDTSFLDSENYFLLRLHALCNRELLKQLEEELEATKNRVLYIEQALSDIRCSRAYRISRIIIYFHSILRGGSRCLKENGLRYTWNHFLEKTRITFYKDREINE